MNRRDFLKACGKAGVAISAAGALTQLLSGSALAQSGAGGGPLVVRLHGLPRDMGKQYADQAGSLIRARLKLLREKGVKIAPEDVEMSRVFLSIKANSIYLEIAALAARLDEKEEDLLMLSAEPPGVGIRKGGCSSFVLDKKTARDGRVWLGQNVDDASDLEKFGVVVIRHPAGGTPVVTWALAGGLGAIGMNGCGLALLMNYVQSVAGRVENAIFPEFVAHAALRQTEFKEMMGVLTETQIMTSATYLAASKDGDRVAIERSPLRYAAWTPPKDYLAYTNHLCDEKMAASDLTDKIFPDSKARLRRLDALLSKKKDVETPEFLEKVLSDVDGAPNSISRRGNLPTIASVVMCPKDGKMFVTKGAPDAARYKEVLLTAKPERE